MSQTPLTLLSLQGGCAAKAGPYELQQLLQGLQTHDRASRSIIDAREDAGFCSVEPGQLIAQSIDVITPISDSAWTFGAVAVAHALSDLYAKGAKPLAGLFMLGLPTFHVATEIAREIVQGAVDKLIEAGASLLGGHTLESQELLFGVAATGTLEGQPIANTGAQESDVLILTKPLGSGIIITALKLANAQIPIARFSPELVTACERLMLTLNSAASRSIVKVGVHACTDVSGFGLIGHLQEMLARGGLSADLSVEAIPSMRGVGDLAAQEVVSAGCERNAAYWWDDCEFASNITYAQKMVLFDPQTSGGLLVSVAPDRVDSLLKELNSAGVGEHAVIGHVSCKERASVVVH